MSRFLRYLACLVTLMFVGNALAAGYDCSVYKKYTSCNSGYYISNCGTSGWTGQTISSGSLTVGNSCKACPSGYKCSGGLVCPKANTVTCSAGYYLAANATSCSACGGNNYYCPGGTYTPSSSAQGRKTVSSGYYSTGGTSTTRTGQSQCTGATYCSGGVKSNCPSGYTANTTAGKTSASSCQISCAGGTYVATANAACTSVGTGYYKAAHTVNYGSTSTRSACPSGYDDGAAASAQSGCKISVAGGKYIKTANSATQSTCSAGTYKAAHTVSYGSTSSCSACTGRTKYSTTGASACSTVSSGYYTTGCNTSNNNCTGQSQCGGNNYYCSGGVRNTVSSGYYSTGGTSTTRTGQSQCTGATYCSSGVKNNCPSGYDDNTTAGKTSASSCQISVSAGKYIATANSATQSTCTAGYACPGGLVNYGSTGKRTQCTGATYAGSGASSCSSCPSGYDDNTTAGKTSASSCQISVSAGKYIATANSATQSTCTAGYACPGGLVNYGSTGKRTQCTGATYAGSGASSCSSCPSGYDDDTTAGKTAASSCKISVAGGKYIKTANSTTQSTCSAGTYKAAHTVSYGSTSSCSACSGRTKYSAAGASACSTVSSGYYTTGCNSSNNNCTGQSQCTGATYCSGGVKSNCPSGYTANTTAGKTSASSCQISCAGGTYVATANAACTSVGTGYYKAAHTVNYGGTSTRSACPSGYDDGAAASAQSGCKISVAGGKYIKTANSATLSTCAAGTYKAAHTVSYGSTSSCSACPDPNTHKRKSFPSNYYSPSFSSTSLSGGSAGSSSISQCTALSWLVSSRGNLYEYVTYDSSTGVYDNTTSYAWHSVAAGYYLTTKSGCGIYAYYKDNVQCPTGYYCPGKSSVTCNASNQATVHTTNFGLNSCPSGYPNSAAGSSAITQCYSNTKSRAWTGSQVNGATPTNCYSVTSWNSCSKSACSYVAYSNSAGTGDGTIRSGCSSNSANCTKTADTTTGKAGYYGYSNGSGQACSSCSSFNASYPSSDAGAPNSNYCYASKTKTGSQVNGSVPTNCSSVTSWNSCTPGTCTYKDYYGITDTTCTPANCTKTPAAVKANANSYVSGTSCKTCSSFSSTYTKSDGGSISNAYCYATKTKTGSQVNGATPTNCYSVTSWNSCTPGTCTYRDYYSATDTTCTPANCTKTPAAVSAKSGYYVSGTSCTACSGLASGFYPNSANGNTGGASACYTDSLSGKYVATANATSATTCPNWTYKGSHTVKYGSTSSCSACIDVDSGWSKASGTGWTSYSSCKETRAATSISSYCSSGQLTKTQSSASAWGTATVSATFQADPGAYVTGSGASSSCSRCGANDYCAGGTAAAKDCPSGYPNSAAGSSLITQCYSNTKSRAWTGSQTACTKPTGCYSVTCNACSDEACSYVAYSNSTGTGDGTIKSGCSTNNASCQQTVNTVTANAGRYVSGKTCPVCSVGTYQGTNGATVTSCSVCSGNTYAASEGMSACSSCPSGYSISGTTAANHDAKSDCRISCAAGTQVVTADAACTTPADSWYSAAHTVPAGSTSGTNVKDCLTNYYTPDTTTRTDHDSSTDCKISCSAGTRIVSANATSCTTPSGNWYIGAHSVSQGSTSSVNSCLANYTISGTAATNHDAASDCKITCSGGSYIATANNTSCSPVGAGFWAAASTVSQGSAGLRNACADGLTTIGSGSGADEAGDCGRVLNFNGEKVYLRSDKKTTPSLNVSISGKTFYGNMGTGVDGALKIKSGSTTYSVYDDSME